MKRLLVAIPLLALGCITAQAQTWHNPKIKNHRLEERQLAIDDGMCTMVADRNIPMPPIVYHSDGTHSFSGWATIWSGSQFSTMTYNGFTRPVQSPFGAFASGFARGAAIGEAIRARMDRYKVHRACMLSLGWEETKATVQDHKLNSDDY